MLYITYSIELNEVALTIKKIKRHQISMIESGTANLFIFSSNKMAGVI